MMSDTQAKRLILLISILLPVLIMAIPLCRADNFPDISKIDQSYVLNNKHQFFIKDSGYVLVSTDSVKETLITILNSKGKPDKNAAIATSVPFAYEQAVQSGDYLYLVGNAPNQDSCVKIARFQITGCNLVQNEIDGVQCDFTRGFHVEDDGSFFLVTVPYGTEINSLSPFRKYVFDPNHEDARCAERTITNSDFTSNSGSKPAVPSSNAKESEESYNNTNTRTYVFEEAVTIEALRNLLDCEEEDAAIRVTAPDGTVLKSGNVGTGFTIEILRNGQVESRITAVIPGDLTGSGKITEQDSVLLYEHITNQRQLTGLFLQAADMNGDGKIDTSDMLRIKKLITLKQ